MSKTSKKNFRFSEDTCTILDAAVELTGSNDSRVTELSIALYAMEIGAEVSRAKQFLYENLASSVAAHRVHRRFPASLSPEQMVEATKLQRAASQRIHEARKPLVRRLGGGVAKNSQVKKGSL